MPSFVSFVVEGAGTAGVDGVYVRDDYDLRHVDYGRSFDRKPQGCAGADVFRKAGTSFALLRKGDSGWSLADLCGSSYNAWSLRSVELYHAARMPAGSTPPPLGWVAVDGQHPAPLVQPSKALVPLRLAAPPPPPGFRMPLVRSGSASVLARTGKAALARNASDPRLPRTAHTANLVLATLGPPSSAGREPLTRGSSMSFVCVFRVVLARPSARVSWGFSWAYEAFKRSGTRLLESVQEGSPLARWNAWQDIRGRRALCAMPGDRLLKVDGRWAYHEAEVGRQDGDQASEAISESAVDAEEGRCLVLDFARPALRPPTPPPPRLEVLETPPTKLVIDWEEAAMGLEHVFSWAVCLQDVDHHIWYVIDGASKVAQPLFAHYSDVGALRPDQTAIAIHEGLPVGQSYVVCIAAMTEKGWSALSELSRPQLLRLDAGAMPTAGGAFVKAPSEDDWPGRPHFALPREILPGASSPIDLLPGPRHLLATSRRLHMRLPLRGGAEALQHRVAAIAEGQALRVRGEGGALPSAGEPLQLHGFTVALTPMPGDIIVRLNGVSGAANMFLELRRSPEMLALTIERWLGDVTSLGDDPDPEGDGSVLDAMLFPLDARLDGSASKSAEEIACCMLVDAEEGVLASRLAESNPEALEAALRRAAAAIQLSPPMQCRFPNILEDAERRLTLVHRSSILAAAAKAAAVKYPLGGPNEEHVLVAALEKTDVTPPSDEQILMALRKAMACASANEDEVARALKQLSQASRSLRSSRVAQELAQRAKDLRSLWQWRRRCQRAKYQLVTLVQRALEHEEDVQAGEAKPAFENDSLLHEVLPLQQALETAQTYRSEMEFDFVEASEVIVRLKAANKRYAAQRGVQAAATNPRQDETALEAALEHAVTCGVSEKVLEAGRMRLQSWRELHEREAHHDELFTALQELKRHLENREAPGAGCDEQRRLRRAIAGSGLPMEDPLVHEAVMALKRWEAQNFSLRAEARLQAAVQRAAKGYSPEEPTAGDLLGSAIAEVSQRGVDEKYLEEARSVLAKWQASRVRKAQASLAQALYYKDQEYLKESLALAREAGVDEETLAEAERCLQRLMYEEEVNKLLEDAMELDGDTENLEHAIQRAHDGCFLEADSVMLRAGVLLFHLRYWAHMVDNAMMTNSVECLEAQVAAADARLAEAQAELAAPRPPYVPEVAYRTLDASARTLDLCLPRARRLAGVHGAEKELRRVLGAVERYAADLPAAIARANEQRHRRGSTPIGSFNASDAGRTLDQELVRQAEEYLEAYNSTLEALTKHVNAKGADPAELKAALVEARLAGAPMPLVDTAFELLEQRSPELAERTRVELELRVSLAESDDVDELPAEGRFLRLQEAAEHARRMKPPVGEELQEDVDQTSVALAAEKTLVLEVAEAKALLAGQRPAAPDKLHACTESLDRSIVGAEQDAQDEAKKGLEEAMELCSELRQEADLRKALLLMVHDEVQSRASGAKELRKALIEAREGFLPGGLLAEAYGKLRRRKLEHLVVNFRAARDAGQKALASALWHRGLALRAADERSGGDWKDRRFQELENPERNRVIIHGVFKGKSCGGSFGTRTWRSNPCYIVKQRAGAMVAAAATAGYLGRSRSSCRNPKITVILAEGAEQPANLSVHVVQNSEDAAKVGCGSMLVPGFQVLSHSKEDDEIPSCEFELPNEEKMPRPTFIVPSSARGEEGPFILVVDCVVPVDVEEVPEELRWPWVHDEAVELEWNERRPQEAVMGGGRTSSASPLLSWYRNPQFRLCGSQLVPPAPVMERRVSLLERRPSVLAPPQPAGVQGSWKPPDEETLKELFKRCDIKGDNRINKIELIKACRSDPDLAANLGLPDHIRQEDGSRDRLEEFFQGMDTDHNRELSWEEFRAFFLQPPPTPASARKPAGPLVLILFTPAGPQDPAAVHVLQNLPGEPGPGLAENPHRHRLLACSGPEGEEYSDASEVGAVCRLPPDGESVIVVPSLETKSCEGRYTLRLLATEKITVERIR